MLSMPGIGKTGAAILLPTDAPLRTARSYGHVEARGSYTGYLGMQLHLICLDIFNFIQP
jgi:hypothetical protein